MSSQEQQEFDASRFAFLLEHPFTCATEKEVSKILSKNQDLACLKKTLETLHPKKRDLIVKYYTMAIKSWNTIQDRERAVSKLTPSNDTDTSHFPSCLKNLTLDLKGSKNVAGDSRHIQLKEDLDKVLLTFKKNASKIYLENAKLELKQAEEKLRRTIFDLLMELAMGANLYICMNYNVEHKVAAMTIAGQSVVHAIRKTKLCSKILRFKSKSDCVEGFKELYFDGILAEHENDNEDDEHYDHSIVIESGVQACMIVEKTILKVPTKKKQNLAHRNFEQAGYEQQEKTKYQKFNQDVVNLLNTKEGDNDQVYNDLVETKVQERTKELKNDLEEIKRQLKVQEQQLKQVTRLKSSGGGTDQSLNARNNGHASKGKQQKQQKFKSNNSKSKTQVRFQNASRQQNASHQGSGKGGGGKSSRRS